MSIEYSYTNTKAKPDSSGEVSIVLTVYIRSAAVKGSFWSFQAGGEMGRLFGLNKNKGD